MGADDNKAVIAAFFDAGNRGDMIRCLALLDEDVRWTNIGSTKYSGTYSGKQALIKDLLTPVFSRLKAGIRSTVESIVAENDYVVAQSRGHAETTEGRPYNNTYCHVFRISNGKIREVTEYMDTELVSAVFGR